MTTRFTRTIQRRHGHRSIPYTCPECGRTRPAPSSFPASGVVGLSALAWATTGRRLMFGVTIRCPVCGAPMTLDEELRRRRRAGRP